MPAKATLKNNQKGLVSIVVTMIIMIVLTLIVTGFAQLARREQREALDRQLSTQALYAAESGINDAISKINDGTLVTSVTDCPNPATAADPLDVGVGDNVQYTCVLVDTGPPTLKFGNVTTTQSTLVPISATGLDSITINWQSKDNPPGGIHSPSGGNFPVAASWGDNVGILRVDLVRTSPGSLDSQGLQNSTLTSFLYPNSGGGGTINYPTNIASDTKGSITQADCSINSTIKKCKVKIEGLGGLGDLFYLRMKSIYNPSDVEICANACNGDTRLTGAQYEIDSTGRANDVLKRVQVRYPVAVDPDVVFPEYVLDSTDDICKLLSVWPGDGDDASCTNPLTP